MESESEKGTIELQHTKSESTLEVQEKAPAALVVEDVFPEGGLAAWMSVVGGFLSIGSTFGISNVFGVLQSEFTINQLEGTPPSQISLIGSAHLSILFASGLISGRLFDRGYFRYQLAAGTILWLAGIFALSVSTTYAQLFLSYSVTMGLGLGQIFAPSLACIGTHFKRRRVLMLGIASSGASLFSTVFPIILNILFKSIGFGSGIRVLGYTMAVFLVIANLIMRPRQLPPRIQPPSLPLIKSFLSQLPTWYAGIAIFLFMEGLFIPLFYFQIYSHSHQASEFIVTYSLAIVSAPGMVSRVLCGFVADRFGVLNVLIPVAFSTGCIGFAMLASTNVSASIIFLIFYGFFAGAYFSLFSPMFMTLAKDVTEIGTRAGVGMLFVSMATLSGTPIAGELLKATGGYVAPVVYGGACMVTGSGILVLLRQTQVKRRASWKV